MTQTSQAQTLNADDPSSFVPAWVKDAIFYQIFPERFANGNKTIDPPNVEPWGGVPKTKNYFGGDLQGIVNRLDYVSDLGVNCLYLTPIFWSNSNHKYHAKDYLTIDPHFGDERVFKILVDECHARGIRIILDGVFNHTGVDFFAFEDIKKNGKKSQYVHWYNIYSFPVGPPSKPNYECWWNWGDLPKLMTHNPDVRDYLFKATEHWMSFGIDGWRLDVPNEIPHPFWIEWRKLVKKLNPDAYIVGEIWDDASPWLQGDQFDAVMNYRFRRACLDFFIDRKSSPSEFDAALAKVRNDYSEEISSVMQNLLGSHDTERFLTLCKNDKETVKLAWLFQMTYVGAPMVYYGDEIGMTGGKDPGSRGTMIWDEAKQDAELLATLKGLIALRNEHPVFRHGTYEPFLADDKNKLYGFRRIHPDRRTTAVVVLNAGESTQAIDIREAGWFRTSDWHQRWPIDAGNKPASSRGSHLLAKKSGLILIGSVSG
ncbi:MAG: glycoside hydrolase family 13 protein [Bacteroidetes bacterium]|nr:glycoside hydrolase family 13 protein [Bacteroidota bacterium]MCW5896029.1 glycoside hydrolase family 13 protein [Bacteroidota bacterium]